MKPQDNGLETELRSIGENMEDYILSVSAGDPPEWVAYQEELKRESAKQGRCLCINANCPYFKKLQPYQKIEVEQAHWVIAERRIRNRAIEMPSVNSGSIAIAVVPT